MAMRQTLSIWRLFLLLGGIGFLLRALQLQFGFESTTGLAKPHCLPAIGLLFLSLISILFAILFSQRLPAVLRSTPFSRFYGTPNRLVHRLCAALEAAMGITLLPLGLDGSWPCFILALFSLLTALCTLALPRTAGHFCWMEHTCFAVACLVLLFTRHASDPNWMGFWPFLAALCCTSFSCCTLFGASCNVPKPRSSACSMLCGSMFCLIALPDCCTPERFPYIFGILAAALLQGFYSRQLFCTGK